MDEKLTLNPGGRGTKKLHGHCGYKLYCGRYRFDKKSGKRCKTIGPFVETFPGEPQPPKKHIVSIKSGASEKQLLLIKNGTDLRYIPEQMGHAGSKRLNIYPCDITQNSKDKEPGFQANHTTRVTMEEIKTSSFIPFFSNGRRLGASRQIFCLEGVVQHS